MAEKNTPFMVDKLPSPEITESINQLTYYWGDYHIKILADRLTDDGKAELWIYNSNGKGDTLLRINQINLLANSTVTAFGKSLVDHNAKVPWQQMMTYLVKNTMEYTRKGEPGKKLNPNIHGIIKPEYFIEPVIMKGVPSVIFGDKGLNKTTISLAMLGLIEFGTECDDSPCGFIASKQAKTGLLDWESNEDLTNYTMSRLIEAKVLPYTQPAYLRCKLSLSDDIQRIANFIKDNQIEVVLIDSLGQAAGSDRYDTAGKASALKFFECLRQLNVTSLIIAQNAKGEEGKKTIYGSTYYTYYSRNIFELKKTNLEATKTEMHVALVHTESNYSKKYDPIGFHITYSDDTIAVERESVTLEQLMDKTNDRQAILNFLKGKVTLPHYKDIAMAIGKSPEQTKVVLSAMKNDDLVVNPERGFWGIKYNGSDKE